MDDLIARALAEDVGDGDITTERTVAADARARATITQKQPGAVFGLEIAERTFRALDPAVEVERRCEEGVWRESGEVLVATGSARALLTGERTALNFLQRLSGVCTQAAKAAQVVAGTGCQVLDTRKTTPGLRALEKQAVAAGGATNHRFGLFDMVLIKENHIEAAGGITAALERVRDVDVPVEIECRTVAEVDEALDAGAEHLLLDNFTPEQLEEIVARVGGRAKLEASGGVTLETLLAFAMSGVQYVSLGALTHSAPALDLSLALEAVP
jgi:nicotinate-nucleotide pyrophosphorylase (carboxylating)